MLANVALTDTFDTLRIRTNQLIVQSDQAYNMANAAYEATNTAVIDAANITANIISSNTMTQNVIYDSVNSIIQIVTDNIASNITNTLSSNEYIMHITANAAANAANAAVANLEIVAFDTANSSYNTANLAYSLANVSFNVANAAFNAANNAVTDFSPAYNKANSAYTVANAAFDKANTAGETSKLNSAFTVANAAYGSSNTRFDVTNTAFTVANASFNFANTYARLVEISDETSNNSLYYVTFCATNSGNAALNVASAKLTFNPYDGTLSSTSFNSLSDISMKDNIRIIPNALDTITKIDGVSFDWKETGKHSFGVIAQDIEKIVPELVDSINSNKTVNYDGIIAFLIEAIKELNRKLEEKQ